MNIKDRVIDPSTRESSVSMLARRLLSHLSRRRRSQLLVLTVVMIGASLAEVISIGMVIPFIGVLIDPEKLFAYSALQPFIRWCDIKSADQLVIPLAFIFSFGAVLAATTKIITNYIQLKISYGIGIDLSYDIFKLTLRQKYLTHTKTNSSELISVVYEKVSYVIVGFLMPMLTTISSLFMLLAVLMMLVVLAPLVTITALLFFVILYAYIFKINKKTIFRASEKINNEKGKVIQILQESLGNIRDIILDGTQEEYSKIYRQAVTSLRNAEASVGVRGALPRYAVEAISMVLIAVVAIIFISNSSDRITVIPTLGAMALAAQRLLPLFNQCYANFTYIYGARATVQETLRLLKQPRTILPVNQTQHPLAFKHEICFTNVSFQYDSLVPDILTHIYLTIPKGTRFGLIGRTGSGKSTVLDILMGLLPPTRGVFEVDGQPINEENVSAWQRRIAHVPQNVFLADTSILENIALGVSRDRIDTVRVHRAAEMAQLTETLNSLPDGHETIVGERGARLSGGQRQRIGIARALYKGVDVLILDEATSALDLETERAVMDGVNRLPADLTVIIVAHRLSTLSGCSEIMEIKEGKLQRVELG